MGKFRRDRRKNQTLIASYACLNKQVQRVLSQLFPVPLQSLINCFHHIMFLIFVKKALETFENLFLVRSFICKIYTLELKNKIK